MPQEGYPNTTERWYEKEDNDLMEYFSVLFLCILYIAV